VAEEDTVANHGAKLELACRCPTGLIRQLDADSALEGTRFELLVSQFNSVPGTPQMLFAHLKRILKLDRLRLRGPCGARDEFHLAATAQNLRKLAKLIPRPQAIPLNKSLLVGHA
jgi:hypothetical protein